MKELIADKKVYLEGYDVSVSTYLTYAQIQQIANATAQLDTWAERQQNIDMLVLLHATDIETETLMNTDADIFLTSGLVRKVRGIIRNYNDIYEAIKYTESTQNTIKNFIKVLGNLPALEDKQNAAS
nr:MAG TPA: hypothetical protein [Caudoviricetes sp.]